MKVSEHAICRGQQRGISRDYMEILTLYGQYTRCPRGAYAYSLGRRDLRELGQQLSHNRQMLDKLRHQVLIGSEDGSVITVYHRN